MRRALVAALRGYKRWLSPLLPRACRFAPTCSEYAALAIEEHGVARGLGLAVSRILRCHPWHPGGVDLPPRAIEI
jgi:putative membrane protein insertion efficiency factor